MNKNIRGLQDQLKETADAIGRLEATEKQLLTSFMRIEALLQDLVKTNRAFIGTLTSFLVSEDKRRAETAAWKQEQAESARPTDDDLRF